MRRGSISGRLSARAGAAVPAIDAIEATVATAAKITLIRWLPPRSPPRTCRATNVPPPDTRIPREIRSRQCRGRAQSEADSHHSAQKVIRLPLYGSDERAVLFLTDFRCPPRASVARPLVHRDASGDLRRRRGRRGRRRRGGRGGHVGALSRLAGAVAFQLSVQGATIEAEDLGG